jgi:hypothetical protein
MRHFNIGDIEVTQKMLRHISHICDGSFMVEHYAPVVRGILVAEDNSFINFNILSLSLGNTRWRSWLRHCATNRKVADLIPDGVTGIFH